MEGRAPTLQECCEVLGAAQEPGLCRGHQGLVTVTVHCSLSSCPACPEQLLHKGKLQMLRKLPVCCKRQGQKAASTRRMLFYTNIPARYRDLQGLHRMKWSQVCHMLKEGSSCPQMPANFQQQTHCSESQEEQMFKH